MSENKLTPAFELVGKTFKIYFDKKNITYILKLVGVQFLIGIALFLPFVILSAVTGVSMSFTESDMLGVFAGTTGILSILSLIVFFAVIYWFGATDIILVGNIAEGKIMNIKETFKAGWEKTFKYLAVTSLAGLIMVAGYILLIIPGIIFSVWFSFAHFVAVLENRRVIESLKKSKSLVQGYFWPVLGRFLLIGVIAFVVNMILQLIPLVGIVMIAFVSPLFILYMILLYKDLVRVKGSLSQVQ